LILFESFDNMIDSIYQYE